MKSCSKAARMSGAVKVDRYRVDLVLWGPPPPPPPNSQLRACPSFYAQADPRKSSPRDFRRPGPRVMNADPSICFNEAVSHVDLRHSFPVEYGTSGESWRAVFRIQRMSTYSGNPDRSQNTICRTEGFTPPPDKYYVNADRFPDASKVAAADQGQERDDAERLTRTVPLLCSPDLRNLRPTGFLSCSCRIPGT